MTDPQREPQTAHMFRTQKQYPLNLTEGR